MCEVTTVLVYVTFSLAARSCIYRVHTEMKVRQQTRTKLQTLQKGVQRILFARRTLLSLELGCCRLKLLLVIMGKMMRNVYVLGLGKIFMSKANVFL